MSFHKLLKGKKNEIGPNMSKTNLLHEHIWGKRQRQSFSI